MSRIPVSKPVMTKEMIEASSHALADERLVMGESVFKFEEEFARYIGTDHALSVSSGTDALILATIALGVSDRQVLTTPFSFVAPATSIVHAGAIPGFVDDSADDYNLDPQLLQSKITKDVDAVMPVDLFGYPARMDEIIEAAGEGVKIIEDVCQAHGAEYNGRKCGSIGDVGCFSFYPTKNMTVGGDGGRITTNDKRLADDVRKLRDCGRVSRYEHDVFDFTSQLKTCNAAIGRVQLRHLEEWNEKRRAIARRYVGYLKNITELTMPPLSNENTRPVFHLFAIQCDNRDALAKHLDLKGVDTAVHYPIPIHKQPAYRAAYGYHSGEFPVSEHLSQRMLNLPMFQDMNDEEVDRVAEEIGEHFTQEARLWRGQIT